MMLIASDKSLVLLLRKPRCRWYSLCCIGRKQHYRKDGTCKHTDAVLAQLRPEVRNRVRISLRGNKS